MIVYIIKTKLDFMKSLRTVVKIFVLIIPTFVFAIEKCDYCNTLLGSTWLEYKNHQYHNNCYTKYIQLKCNQCNNPITDSFIEFEDKNYHPTCYTTFILPKCNICLQPLEGEYVIDSWNNKYHKNHVNDGVKCNSCTRIISQQITNGGFQIHDGRYLCSLCEINIVKTSNDINKSLQNVLDVFENVGLTHFPIDIPINLVDKLELGKLSKSLSSDHLKGFTHTIETKTMFNTHREFTVYILTYLPQIEFEAVLAHELLHVWLLQNKIELSLQETEGFCNLGSMLIYNEYKTTFSDIHLESMQMSEDQIYGVGFRKMKNKLNSLGWNAFLTILKK
jgi:hypothetical protein